MDANDLIGRDNKLPWKLTNDLSYFRKKTWGKNIVMGRKTFESIGVLPNRNSIVLTRNPEAIKKQMGVSVIHHPDSIINRNGEYFVIGGAEIYKQFLPHADVMYITQIDESFDGDTYFPKWDWKDWKLESEEKHFILDGHEYDHTFFKYVREN